MLPSGSQYSTGLNFMCFDTTTGGWDGSFKQFGPEIANWSDQGPTFHEYLDAITGKKVDVSIPANFDSTTKHR